jgi:hypothetical protein
LYNIVRHRATNIRPKNCKLNIAARIIVEHGKLSKSRFENEGQIDPVKIADQGVFGV